MEFDLNEARIAVALTKLLKDLDNTHQLESGNAQTMWDIVEQLDSHSFANLHRNVYFADFLRQIAISFSVDSEMIELSNQIEISNDEMAPVIEAPSNDEVPQELTQNEQVEAFQLDVVDAPLETASDQNPEVETESFIVPNLATQLDDLILPDRFLKLIKRLRNASLNNSEFRLGDTLEDLVSISVGKVASLNGVGFSYVETLKELKAIVASQSGIKIDSDNSVSKFALDEIDTSNYLISMAGVEPRFLKALAKYARHVELPNLAEDIDLVLSLVRQELLNLPGFGKGVVDTLIEFKGILQTEIQAIVSDEINYLAFESTIIVPKIIQSLTLNEIEQLLLEDIDNFLEKLPDDEGEIAQRRWGFVEEKQTLEEVGAQFGVTRERIRQKEALINARFCLNLRVNPTSLWQLLQPAMQAELKEQIPDLFQCFSTEKAFYEFLDIICQQEKLFEYVYPEIDKSILNTFFAENGAPILLQDAIDVIEDANLENVRNHKNAVLNLQRQGVIVVEGENIWPCLLGKSEASACVLVNHPRGLPWLDIAKLVNANSYSRSEIYVDRLDHEAFKHKDYIYLAGKGVYKHTRFINAEIIDLDTVFTSLDDYMETTAREVFHLNECYQSSEYLKRFNYYEIRHFVKHFGEDYGYYFAGRSQADSVGREKGFKNITQKDVIIEAMNAREKPFTKPEVAGLLKSKSLGHAAYYLDGMIDEAKVVQVDRQMYTTPQQAYKNIELQTYLQPMQHILEKCSKPVDASIFQQALNPLLSVSYSKYFYMGIARCHAAEQGWHRAHGLYSVSPIAFNSLTDALNKYCTKDQLVKDSIECLQQHIAITKENASQIIHNWRNATVT
ncbi:sigma factor-like helix-turn-helix DNA-binding protein [Shewanella sp. 6_MG-2023]|uniref:sigma factor-like helix-turn-helix DNA-binding protein n=1 Tax=Shewanella sp. 6_MG-2023 TaxID=3062660 RepID=UPI0026E12D7F|nr:sigma factor-like helix-turn-helix DNA-binding protein [Shewanella sp. 6_MG-2023]MDO6620145.1 sigma factor-like helix-turn-helix DNA-binding protein [Shewanella sp. 6_MG-2023]